MILHSLFSTFYLFVLFIFYYACRSIDNIYFESKVNNIVSSPPNLRASGPKVFFLKVIQQNLKGKTSAPLRGGSGGIKS